MRLDLGQRLKACISLAGWGLKAEVHWEWGQAGRGERERELEASRRTWKRNSFSFVDSVLVSQLINPGSGRTAPTKAKSAGLVNFYCQPVTPRITFEEGTSTEELRLTSSPVCKELS